MSVSDPRRRHTLHTLWASGWTLREIAEIYGGTPQGVRSTIRKMRERGDAPNRKRVMGGKSKWVVE